MCRYKRAFTLSLVIFQAVTVLGRNRAGGGGSALTFCPAPQFYHRLLIIIPHSALGPPRVFWPEPPLLPRHQNSAHQRHIILTSDVAGTAQQTCANCKQTLPATHCKVLPPGEFNRVVPMPLPTYHESFMRTAATVLQYSACQFSLASCS